jgi:hypothetical protein
VPPLFEKEGDTGTRALIPDGFNSRELHGSRTRATFPSDDHPVNTHQINLPKDRTLGKTFSIKIQLQSPS